MLKATKKKISTKRGKSAAAKESSKTTANGTAAEKKTKEENNNTKNHGVNKTSKINDTNEPEILKTAAAATIANSDEVIEEFDFSDSDLRALSDDDESKAAEKAKNQLISEKNAIDIESDGNDNNDKETNASNNNHVVAQNTIEVKEQQHQDQQQQQQKRVQQENKTNAENDNKDNVGIDDSDGNDDITNKDFAIINVSSAVVTDNNNEEEEAICVDARTRRRKEITPPVNLVLNDTITTATTEDLPYCPITPRCVVDTIDNDIDNDQLSTDNLMSQEPASTTTTTMMTTKKQRNTTATTNGTTEDDDEYYDEEPPEDELLVQFLGEANRIAEARLAARRQARAEAREIRMRELERQQKEQEQNADRVFDMHNTTGTSGDPLVRTRLTGGVVPAVGSLLNTTTTRVVSASSMSSRRSSEDSLEEEGRSLRDIRHELKDVEERFRKAMIANAQLDNDRASQTFEVKLLKDKIETMQESYAQLEREFKEKSRDYNALKRNLDRLTLELKLVEGQLNERDTLIAEQGLVIVAVENADGTDAKRALVSVENANVLASVQGSLDVRLKKFNEEKQQLVSEVQKLQVQLDAYKNEGKGRGGNSLNGPLGSDEDYEAQREANKIISDYKYKLQKAEQEIASLQASLARSETQVIRYKSTAEAAEKAEAELKVERRKLQRENREAMERLEELETSNNHLLKRLDKLKNAKSALLKDL